MNEDSSSPRRAFGRGFRTVAAALSCCVAVAAYFRYGPGGGVGAVALTGRNFKSAIASGVHVVDFWAEWCVPCRVQERILEAFAARHSGRVGVGRVDVDADPAVARECNIEGIPTVIIYRDGVEVGRFVGVAGREQLARAVDGLP